MTKEPAEALAASIERQDTRFEKVRQWTLSEQVAGRCFVEVMALRLDGNFQEIEEYVSEARQVKYAPGFTAALEEWLSEQEGRE